MSVLSIKMPKRKKSGNLFIDPRASVQAESTQIWGDFQLPQNKYFSPIEITSALSQFQTIQIVHL